MASKPRRWTPSCSHQWKPQILICNEINQRITPCSVLFHMCKTHMWSGLWGDLAFSWRKFSCVASMGRGKMHTTYRILVENLNGGDTLNLGVSGRIILNQTLTKIMCVCVDGFFWLRICISGCPSWTQCWTLELGGKFLGQLRNY
jgi:hypothetical protein